ncbi:ABC transporter permease [Mariniblastus sp.]|nr:ABC transporter permease [Mariniblastus sp.]
MRKIITIAVREYKAMVATKAFLLSIIVMPVIMLGSILVMSVLQSRAEIKTLRIAVIDHTGVFSSAIQAAAEKHNQRIDSQIASGQTPDLPAAMGITRERYQIESVDAQTNLSQAQRTAQLLKLSDRIRDQQLYAILEIPAEVSDFIKFEDSEVEDLSRDSGVDSDKGPNVVARFYSQESSLADAKRWLSRVINQRLRDERLWDSGIDPAEVVTASEPLPLTGMGLVERATDGRAAEVQQQQDPFRAIFVPLGVMLLMFVVIFMAAQPMLESVLEEKSQRIAEVMLGSVSSFQLMLGKLLGTVSGSLTVFSIYVIGLLCWSVYTGASDQIPFELAPWFVVFQILGVLFYAAIFLAIGASVSQLKEAQAFLMPVWLLMLSPMFVWLLLIRDPLGSTSVWMSLFPPATPTVMMLRLATGQAIPWWQPVLGAVLLTLATLAVVIFAARIFRAGILWQGKTPRLAELIRWAWGE